SWDRGPLLMWFEFSSVVGVFVVALRAGSQHVLGRIGAAAATPLDVRQVKAAPVNARIAALAVDRVLALGVRSIEGKRAQLLHASGVESDLRATPGHRDARLPCLRL